ncbi:MAG: hypothetical protein ACYTEI_01985 [Planctomycetota bacterium]|jgi:hypothetical protein
MKKFFAAGLVLLAVSTAAARPLDTDPADTDRPVEADRAAPARRPLEPGQIAVGRPLEPGWVAADAMWLIHLDVGAFKNSTIGRYVLEHPDQFELEDLDEFEQEVGLHPLTDFMSFTLYGFSDDPEADGVVVAVTTARADEALARLKAIEEIDSVEVNLEGYPVQVLSDQGERHYLHVRAADRRDQRIVVLAGSEDVLLRAIKVIDNRAPGLSAGRSSILDGGPDRGSIVFVACGDIEALGGVEPASEILRLSDGVTLDIGEAQGRAYGEATVSATSPESAASIAEVVQGMIALGRLIAAEEPEARPLADLAKAINVGVHDQKITIRISFDAEQLAWILGAIDEL